MAMPMPTKPTSTSTSLSLISRARAAIAKALAPAQPEQPTALSITPPTSLPAVRATNTSGIPYDAGSSGRRSFGWNPTRLGPTTNILLTWDRMLARSRDAIRNDPWASSAIDNFESQVISTGIVAALAYQEQVAAPEGRDRVREVGEEV